MSWRIARSLLTLRAEIDAVFPRRSDASDGDKGDPAHAARGDDSDHNPWVRDPSGVTGGVVTAIDITDDDKTGADMRKLVEWMIRTKPRRVKYVIHDREIISSYATRSHPAWARRPYSGPNAHTKHVHVSVNPEPRHFDDGDSWGVAAAWARPAPKPAKAAPRPVVGPHPLRVGSEGDQVKEVQRRAGGSGKVDGVYGARTAAAVRAFQLRRGMRITGVVDQATARRLGLAWRAR